VNSATRKALKAPNERQSRLVCGLKKLKAKRMKIAELMIHASAALAAQTSRGGANPGAGPVQPIKGTSATAAGRHH
jgi:hypothetical protein